MNSSISFMDSTIGVMYKGGAPNTTGLWNFDPDGAPNTTCPCNVDPADYTVIRYWLEGVALIFIGSIGLITNALNIIILSIAIKRRHFILHKLFLCMSIADFTTMLVILTSGIMFGIDSSCVNMDDCVWRNFYYALIFVFSISATVSNWIACLLSLFRLLAASFPLQAPVIITSARVYNSIAAAIIVTVLSNIPLWIVFRNDNQLTMIESRDTVNITIVLCEVIPVFVCLLTTTLLIAKLSYERRALKFTLTREQKDSRLKEQRLITVTLIAISTVFVIANLPDAIFNIIEINCWWSRFNVSCSEAKIADLVTTDIAAFGYACNFFVYIAGNRSFRRELLEILRLDKKRRIHI